MDAILTTALVGTARRDKAEAETGTPVDDLLQGQDAPTPERRLLLLSGALATYRLAGHVPETLEQAPEAAPAETRTLCSPGALAILRELMEDQSREGYSGLLREVFTRLDAANQRVPAEMLPQLLSDLHGDVHEAAIPALGERALWLGGLNSAWAWVREERAVTGDASSAEVETIWQEGTPARRLRALRLVRASDPARARTWITDVWKQEKVEFREDLLRVLMENLSAEDEPLLESALNDRGSGVRSLAQKLLASIPTSAWHERMAARADTLIALQRNAFEVTLPKELEKSWQRDGVVAKPLSSSVGERSWWLQQVLSFVPPSHWEQHFGLSPEQLVAAAQATKEHGPTIIEAWVKAVDIYAAGAWALPLWNVLITPKALKGVNNGTMREMRAMLAEHLPIDLAERYARDLVEDKTVPDGVSWISVAGGLPQPWSDGFARAYLAGLRTFLREKLTPKNYSPDTWSESVPTSALSLPPSVFAAALEPWDMVDSQDWRVHQWHRSIGNFTELVKLRQRIPREIPLPQEGGR